MFFIPLFDDNPTGRWPIVTWMIIACCILIFFYQISLPEIQSLAFILQYATIPAVVTGQAVLPVEYSGLPPSATLISSVFLHGGWMHIAGNMLFLWIYGDNVEERMGHFKFLAFYLICGIVASISHVLISPNDTSPLIGASGAIAGVMGAYLLMFPRAKIRVLVIILVFIRWIYLPAFVVLGSWLLLQIFAAPSSLSAEGGVAYFAHLGGFIAGLALTPLFKKSDTVLLPKSETPPDWVVEPVSSHQVKSEFVERYRRQRRIHVPNVKRPPPASEDKPKNPWDQK